MKNSNSHTIQIGIPTMMSLNTFHTQITRYIDLIISSESESERSNSFNYLYYLLQDNIDIIPENDQHDFLEDLAGIFYEMYIDYDIEEARQYYPLFFEEEFEEPKDEPVYIPIEVSYSQFAAPAA